MYSDAEGNLLRQINPKYEPDYTALMDSGLYQELVNRKLLISHSEADLGLAATKEASRIIQPERVRWISYPYEWCFSQLKDAALTTLEIQKLAISHGLCLKDASAYNLQFHKGRPTLIDTLSFERYKEGAPWIAYRQFCQHFLAPLALMSLVDISLGQLSKTFIDGVPLELASELLPMKTKFSSLQLHIHLHAKAQKRDAGKATSKPSSGFAKTAMLGLVDNLESAVKGLQWEAGGTEWGNYYQETNYSKEAMEAKKALVKSFIEQVNPETVWDLGANTGDFSKVAASLGIPTVAWDIDPAAVEKNYLEVKKTGDELILPLIQDLTNPSPAIGWANRERESFGQRGPVSLVLALALIHHLAIGNNVPLDRVAAFFAETAQFAIVEFVPKTDSQVQRMLASREDIFTQYDQPGFESAFGNSFEILRKEPVIGSERTLYLLRRI